MSEPVKLQGVITALITPFHRGEVDYRSFKRMLISQLSDGVDGVVVNGTTAESPTLHFDEVQKLFDITKSEVAGQIPVLLGTGSNCTRRTIEMTGVAAKWGADAALVVTPYYNKPPQRGLVAHFRAIADACDIPIVLYNVPSRTITAMTVETVQELSTHPRIIALKEASGDLAFLKSLRAVLPKDFILLSGDDASCVEFCLQGGQGVISVVSHLIPMELGRLLEQARAGQASAAEEFKKFSELLRCMYSESNPIGTKAAVYLRGLIDAPEMRLPLVELAEDHMTALRDEMRNLDKIGE